MSDQSTTGDLRDRLSPLAFEVTQHKGTERAFTGAFTHHKDRGTYGCVCCGADLFASDTKYDSGSGWPSFWTPLAGEAGTTTTHKRAARARAGTCGTIGVA